MKFVRKEHEGPITDEVERELSDDAAVLADVRAMAEAGLVLIQMLENKDVEKEIFLIGASQRLTIDIYKELYKKVSEHFR